MQLPSPTRYLSFFHISQQQFSFLQLKALLNFANCNYLHGSNLKQIASYIAPLCGSRFLTPSSSSCLNVCHLCNHDFNNMLFARKSLNLSLTFHNQLFWWFGFHSCVYLPCHKKSVLEM